MLSFGCTKNVLTKIFIYEALVLVIASSFGGFIIGIFIGNLITVQQAMLQSAPFKFKVPLDQLQLMTGLSFICAIFSTWGAARNILKQSIPDIQRNF